VTDKARAITATTVGAIIGGAVGYLFFTDRGRTLRRQIEPVLEDFARELNQFGGTLYKSAGIASEGWKLLSETVREAASRGPRYSPSHQSSPF
jgi:gas vesicle protein